MARKKQHYGCIRVAQSDTDIRNASISQEQWREMQAAEKRDRELRNAERDAAYKRALGLVPGQPLPKALGTAGGTRTASYVNLRGSKRLA